MLAYLKAQDCDAENRRVFAESRKGIQREKSLRFVPQHSGSGLIFLIYFNCLR